MRLPPAPTFVLIERVFSSTASSRFFPFIARVIRLRVLGKLVNEHVPLRVERAAMKMKNGSMSKRDEAVAPVREGSVVFGASRYDSSLRCTRRRTRRFRRQTLHLISNMLASQSRICSIRGRPFLAANVGESEARPFSSDVERARLPCVRSRGGGPSLVIASFVHSITPRVPIPRFSVFLVGAS